MKYLAQRGLELTGSTGEGGTLAYSTSLAQDGRRTCAHGQWDSAEVSQRASESNCGSCGQINLTKNNLKQHFWEFQLKTASSVNRRARGERRKTRQTDGQTDRTFGLESSLLKRFFPCLCFHQAAESFAVT